MTREIYDNYLTILKAELMPAMGCTEPIAVAYAASVARAVLGTMPERIKMRVSGNIVKNVQGVVVPNAGGGMGIEVAAVLGAVGGREDLKLEVLSMINEQDIEEMEKLVARGVCSVELAEGEENLYIRAELCAGSESAAAVLRTRHDHISLIEKNGKTIYRQDDPKLASYGDKSLLNIQDIYEFAGAVDIEDVRETISRQIECNRAIALEGLSRDYGSAVGKTLLETYGDKDWRIAARAMAAAGSDARMGGCALPVMINSGSGNQGIAVSMPVYVYAEVTGCSEELCCRALTLANLLSLHQKRYIGNLSAYCGAVSAGCSAVCGIAYIDGEPVETIGRIIVNATSTIGGMVCDGAKSSCAAKISSAIEAGLTAYDLARSGRSFKPGEGMVTSDVEQTISNIGRMGREGMRSTDVEILNIMLGH